MLRDDPRPLEPGPPPAHRRSPICRSCGQALYVALDLGAQPRADAFREPGDRAPETMFHLQLGFCEPCHLGQIVDEVSAELMFHESYPFRTASSRRMQRHFQETAAALLAHPIHAHTSPFIVEFGCNDGTFLTPLAEAGVAHLGIDPAANLVAEAAKRGIHAQTGWFDEHAATAIRAAARPATVIYAANTLCHISDIATVFRGVDILLAKHGRFVFEDPYLGDILRLGAFDQIYDEHIFYFTATSVDVIARTHGLALVDVQSLATHGGQLRYTVARPHVPRSPAVDEILEHEQETGLHTIRRLDHFANAVRTRRIELVQILKGLVGAGKRVAGYAATAKSATVLNYCGIGPALLDVIYDTTPEKQGRMTPGTGIPVAPFPATVEQYPDVFLLFAWNHAREVAEKETVFRDRGGLWLQYIPSVTLTKVPLS